MNTTSALAASVTAGVIRRLMQIAVIIVLQALILFLTAGDWRWLEAWGYLAIYFGFVLLNAAILLPRCPDMIAERGQIKANTKRWDVVIATLIGVFGLATLMVAGLARRLGWPGALDLPAKIVGIVLYVFGYALFEWAMISNAFFSGMVRIQEDRGHQVATGGRTASSGIPATSV